MVPIRPVSILSILALALGGCAASVAHARDASFDDGTYARLQDVLPDPAAHPLAGRVIVIDPGHGGSESGAVGPGGLKEKDVNLAVGRELARLLKEAGAEVTLTREGDTGCLAPPGPLAADLRARISLANRLHADLFVSVHHNATLDPHNERNQTETYYKMDDPGPSFDAAQAIHRHLLKNLGLPQEKVVPGNYAVLRNAAVPAVLGEASYLSNAFTEQKLRQADKLEIEAQAYYAGILDYFSRGTPKVATLFVADADSDAPTIVSQLDGGGAALDPGSISLTLDGVPRPAHYDTEDQSAIYQIGGSLPNGDHAVTLWARNVAGNRTTLATLSVRVSRPVEHLILRSPLSVTPLAGPMPVVARALDKFGMPVGDGAGIRFQTNSGHFESDRVETRDGTAIAYLEPGRGPLSVQARVGRAKAQLAMPARRSFTLSGRALDGEGKPLDGATVMALAPHEAASVKSQADGHWWMDPYPAGFSEIRFLKPGYRPQVFSLLRPAYLVRRMEPIAPGFGASDTIVLNPEGGPEDRDPGRRKAGPFNWLVADRLRAYLEAAGARVALTRNPDESPSDVQRVRFANDLGATLFLTIGHRATDSVETSHYPGSRHGQEVAKAVRESLLGTVPGIRDGGTAPDSSYTLIQTTSPSVTTTLGAVPTDPDDQASQARKEAYALLLGLLPAEKDPVTLDLSVLTAPGQPVRNALVTLDTTWTGQTDGAGRWTFRNLTPGEHFVSVTDGRRTRTFWVTGLAPRERRALSVDLSVPELPENLAHLTGCR
jgi:N-acetylmuramoyl-L-alanine amidase